MWSVRKCFCTESTDASQIEKADYDSKLARLRLALLLRSLKVDAMTQL